MKTNTWTNEFGDTIFSEKVGNGMASDTFYIAKNNANKKSRHFNSLKSAKIYLNKLRKAKKWVLTEE